MIHLVLVTSLKDLGSFMYFSFTVINDIPVANFADCTNSCSPTHCWITVNYCLLLFDTKSCFIVGLRS